MTDASPSRRRFLRGLGGVALVGAAGCSALPGGGEDAPTLSAATLRSVVDEDAPDVPRTLPVPIEAAYLDAVVAGIEETLAGVPITFTASHVPNGAIREELTRQRERVATRRDTAAEAASPYEALQSLHRARGDAASVAAAWAAIEDGLTRGELLDRTSEIEDARSAFVERWTYHGVDPARSAVVHSAIEQRVQTTTQVAEVDASVLVREPENPLTVGELAEDLARGVAAIEDAAYLYDRYLASLDEPRDQLDRLEDAAATLVGRVEARHRALPAVDGADPSVLVDRDVSETPAAEVLEGLYWRLDSLDYVTQELADGRPAHAILVATTTLAAARALDSVREAIEAGETYAIETVDDVRTRRSDAVSALAETVAQVEDRALANADLTRLADQVDRVDERLAGHDDEILTELVSYEVAEYVQVAAMARALPATIEAVSTVFDR